jgi:hypothetical protein
LENFNKNSDEFLVRSILEAEIRMSAVLPEKILRAVFQVYPEEATLLLSQAPEQCAETIHSFFQQQQSSLRPGRTWFALGNMLLEIKSPAFPLILMQDIKQAPITVYVRNRRSNYGPGPGSSGTFGIPSKMVPLNYPPITFYRLFLEPSNPVIVTFKGPRTFYGIAAVVNPGESSVFNADLPLSLPGLSLPGISGDLDQFRLEYLSSFLALPEEEITFSRHISLDWKGPRQYKEAMRLHCSRILAIYDRIINRLRERGLITASKAKTLGSNMVLKIYDERENKTVSLPDLSMNRVVIEK